ncbi:type IV secretion protein Rhs, partial [Klebsiella oxytoca]
DATITNDWVQGLSLPIDGSRDIPNANYKIRKKSNEGYQYRHRDWIDSGSFWNANNGITWNQLMPILDSW